MAKQGQLSLALLCFGVVSIGVLAGTWYLDHYRQHLVDNWYWNRYFEKSELDKTWRVLVSEQKGC